MRAETLNALLDDARQNLKIAAKDCAACDPQVRREGRKLAQLTAAGLFRNLGFYPEDYDPFMEEYFDLDDVDETGATPPTFKSNAPPYRPRRPTSYDLMLAAISSAIQVRLAIDVSAPIEAVREVIADLKRHLPGGFDLYQPLPGKQCVDEHIAYERLCTRLRKSHAAFQKKFEGFAAQPHDCVGLDSATQVYCEAASAIAGLNDPTALKRLYDKYVSLAAERTKKACH